MKKFKKGFSLAEILIALSIIAVIATMCFSIAKRGIERAYDLYIYTAYQGLADAISDANYSNQSISINQDDLTDSNDFIKHLAKLFSAEVSSSGGVLWITAPNQVKYGFKKATLATQKDSQGNIVHQIYIDIQVPSKKDSTNKYSTYTVFYSPDLYNGNLIPMGDIADRTDLLPFYIETGNDDAGNGRVYYSAKEAFCSIYRKTYGANLQILGGGTIYPSGCPNTVRTGVVKVADPRVLKY